MMGTPGTAVYDKKKDVHLQAHVLMEYKVLTIFSLQSIKYRTLKISIRQDSEILTVQRDLHKLKVLNLSKGNVFIRRRCKVKLTNRKVDGSFLKSNL